MYIKYPLAIVFLLLLVVGIALVKYQSVNAPTAVEDSVVTSFATCAAAGYPVMESYPRQCRTPDGRIYAEEIVAQATYTNATEDNITVSLPFPGAVTGKEFSVVGEARGNWYFEASFPVEVVDMNGAVIATGIAQAQSNWMTEDFVAFIAPITVPQNFIGPATLVLKKDNPSGEPERDASMQIPITIEY